jgi:hypothetical protein
MNVSENDRYKKYTATALQTVFVYDFPVYDGESVVVVQEGTELTYGVDYTVSDVGETAGGNVTLTVGATEDDIVVVYSGTPEARTTQYTGTTVDVDAANTSDNTLTFQTQQLRRDVGRSIRNNITDGAMDELPDISDRKSNLASWDSSGNLTYEDPSTGVLSGYLKKDQNLSDVDSVATARTNLGLGDSATKDVGTSAGTVASGTDSRFLTSGQKGALTGGASVNASSLHTHTNLIPTSQKGVASGVATLNTLGKLTETEIPDGVVTSAATGSTDNEIVVFNSTSGSSIKNSSKSLPTGAVVGTTDTQTLTNKTLDVDSNTVSNIEVDNLKAGVLDIDLSSVAVTDTTIPSAKATKTYADTKAGSVSNIGTGIGIGHSVLAGDLKLKTIKPGVGIAITEDTDDITIINTGGGGGGGGIVAFQNIGTGDGEVFKDIQSGTTARLRTILAGDNITVTNNEDDIEIDVTGLGTMASQDADDVAITGGTITNVAITASTLSLSAPLSIESGGTGATDVSGARANLGLGTIATQDADDITITGGSITGITDIAIADGGTGASTASDARDNLGLTIGTDVQAYDATLQSISALGTASDKYAYTTGIDTWAEGDITAAGRAILDDADASAQRTTLGLGTIATQDSDDVTITGGSITGITDLAIADGGTGASTATVAFDNLSPTTTKGDIIVNNGTDNIRLAVGSNSQVIVADSSESSGARWGNANGGILVANRITTAQSLPASVYTEIIFNSESGDMTDWFDTSNGRFTPLKAGNYIVSFNALVQAVPLGIQMGVQLRKNGSTNLAATFETRNFTANQSKGVTAVAYLNGSTDYISAYIYNGNSSALNSSSTPDQLNLQIAFLGEPAKPA